MPDSIDREHSLKLADPANRLGYGVKAERAWVCSAGDARYYGFDAPVRRQHKAHKDAIREGN